MKKLTLTACAVLVAGAAILSGGCNDSNASKSGSFLYYHPDEFSPAAEDTSDQTLVTGESTTVDKATRMLARQYDATQRARYQAAAAPKLDPPLASAEDIKAAEARVDELRGSVKKAKNGAIIGIVVESQDLNLEDMKLFGRLADLESFACVGENVTDELFAQFKDLKKLKNIRVQNSMITTETIELFATFPELETLDIRRNLQLENSDLAIVATYPKLKKLGAYYNSFTNSGVIRISKSTTITSVDFRGCPDISDSSAKYLARMEQLEEVFFRFGITNTGVEHLAGAPNLKFVEFQDCLIDNDCAPTFAQYPSLEGLRIFRCNSFTNDGVKELANLKVERLELRDLSASDEGVLPLKDMTTLKTVELSELDITSDTINTLVSAPGWSGMTSLSFFSVPVTDEVAKSIAANMKGLESITIRAAGNVSDAALEELAKIDTLTTIDLRENAGFTIDGFMKLANLKNLRRIYVKGTAFGDSSPEVSAKWEEFKKINPRCEITTAG
ncbi:MAG: hypothetical protein ACOX0A_06805 [Thermoguttaceae bacterium]|jgi:Leucine-rich repeat (LRR) protein